MDGTILVADDDRTIRTVLTQALTRAGCRVHATGSLGMLMKWVEEGKGDLVISDVAMPDGNGLDFLPRIARERPGLPVIIISAQNTIMTAIRATEAEAYDYLPKPFDLPDLMRRVARALERERIVPLAADVPEQGDDLPLVGRTPRMQALYRLVAQVMNTDLPILVTGESGTGKSLIARAIHDLSDRRALPFVVAKDRDFAGFDGPSDLLMRAGGGTILLDEPGDFGAGEQSRIVRMLDSLDSPDRIDVKAPRMMATAQRDLVPHLDAQGGRGFRSDLYYRLTGAQIDVPALRDRVDDIPLLAAHFLAQAERDGAVTRRFSDAAIKAIRAHPWPGNVRQLENFTRRLVATSRMAEISRDEVGQALGTLPAGPQKAAPADSLSEMVEQHMRRQFGLQAGQLPLPGLYRRVLREVEAPLIEVALGATGGNQAKCAELLGINRNTLRKKITDLDIRVTRRCQMM